MKNKLNILFISKYPPIEGGEAAKIYWLAKGLGERGHNIYIVSNCQEVEEEYSITIDAYDINNLQPKNVKLFSTSPLNKTSFIPLYNPYSEKLTSLALEVAKEYNIDLIIGWYLLPYVIAAHNTAKILNKKFLLQHAGSDINHILLNPYLYSYLEKIILDADYVMAYYSMIPFFQQMGVQNIFHHKPAFADYFNINQKGIDWKKDYNLDIVKEETYLFLGKMSKRKGIELVLKVFKNNVKNKNLVIFGNGKEKKHLKKEYSSANIHFLKAVPPWQIPSILNSAKAVIVPEYNFGVKQHKSRVPVESLLCGAVPIISNQISKKYGSLKDYFPEFNPLDSNSLSLLINNNKLLNNLEGKIKKNYNNIKEKVGSFDNYIKTMEKFFYSILE